ncbi:Hint domain-containing protein [Microvirga massiliensis]|uniref:Hint domain-containing protein n=1 Tax=Microvirga massiliensis TaxID=1033741 RepID=UPI000AC54DC5|nr:Hint domain-containing protein [Microvirga massiliensis]
MPQTSDRYRPVNRARRHFVGLAAAASAKVAAVSALAVTTLSSSASARNGNGNAFGWEIGKGNPHKGGGHCFLRGTSILTPAGEVRIEDLRIGDLVETVRGEAMPIKWIGRHLFRKSGAAWSERVMPIRISRHALDERTPHTDLYLSPEHALFIDGVLMPVEALVNGTSIVPALPSDMETVEYFHILLDSHEVILAEGAHAETCLLRGSDHEHFTNFIEYERLYGSGPRPVMEPFAPQVGFDNAREHLKGLLLLGLSPFVQVHDPVRSAWERLAARAEECAG